MKLRTILALALIVGTLWYLGYIDGNRVVGKATSMFDKPVDSIVVEDNGAKWEVYFCPQDSCMEHLLGWVEQSEEIKCALYDLDLEPLMVALQEKQALVVVDNDNAEGLDFARIDGKQGLMHNKFCVFDSEVVWTGSMNPTERGTTKNNNNVVVLHSREIAKNYLGEFDELWEGSFGKGERTATPNVVLNGKLIETYFCPEDWCANRILEELEQAEESIHFMTFSFTHDKIGDKLVEKHTAGIEVEGVFEKSQNNVFTEFNKLEKAGIPVAWDTNKYNMHHKVFIIDGKTVMTGSFNPTKSADTRNDENLVIIHDENIAGLFEEEFEKIFI